MRGGIAMRVADSSRSASERSAGSRSRSGLTRRGVQLLAAMLLLGTAARVALAFRAYGVPYDIDSFGIVAESLREDTWAVYDTGRWPYPGGFFPLVWLSDRFAGLTGLAFHGVIQLPAIMADAAIAWMVQDFLGRRGRPQRERLTAAGLVALGPSFALISGYHGQIDSVAILPAVAALALWGRDIPRRGPIAGLLIGLGAAVKSVPFFVVFALLPTARGNRERAALLAGAVAVPLASVAPFFVADAPGLIDGLTSNRGVPGFAGLSVLVQPDLARYWVTLDGGAPELSALNQGLYETQNIAVGAAVFVAAALLFQRRVSAAPAAALIWLVVYAVNPNFAFQYLIWGLPFFLLAGYLKHVLVFQAAVLLPSLLIYKHWGAATDGWLYVLTIQLVWLGLVGALLAQLRLVFRKRHPPPAPQPAT